jgi:hypothetical protein
LEVSNGNDGKSWSSCSIAICRPWRCDQQPVIRRRRCRRPWGWLCVLEAVRNLAALPNYQEEAFRREMLGLCSGARHFV